MDADELEEVKKQIREINPDAKITESYQDGKSEDWWTEVMSDEEAHAVGDGEDEGADNSGQQAFEQMTFDLMEFNSVVALTAFCDDLLRKQYGDIARAKGVVKVGNEALRFDIADNSYVITGGEEPYQAVFIGSSIEREKLLVDHGKYSLAQNMPKKVADKGYTKIRPR